MTAVEEPLDHEKALDDIDAFIRAGHELAALEILAEVEFRPAASALCDVAQELMASNEYMAGWLNRFRYFDFKQDGWKGEFKELLKEYDTTKSSPHGFNRMKFRCAEIWTIYQRDIEATLGGLPPENQDLAKEVRRVCYGLGESDDRMVAFIYQKVLSSVDAFRESAEASLNRSDLNGAETARLHFSVASKDLSTRLVLFANDLSDLVLTYARIARRPVILDAPTVH
jgi:hypothetical protein